MLNYKNDVRKYRLMIGVQIVNLNFLLQFEAIFVEFGLEALFQSK